MKLFLISNILYLLLFCSCGYTNCNPESITVLSIDSSDVLKYKYSHSILIPISNSCADSLTIMPMIQNYMDTVKTKPIRSIAVYNSDYYWYKSKYSAGHESDWNWENCIVLITLDSAALSVTSKFQFFNTDGTRNFEGSKWR